MSTTSERPQRAGLLQGLAAYLLWGALPVYFLAMAPAGPFEIVGWRILFSLVFCAVVLTVLHGWRALQRVVRSPRTLLLVGVAGALIWVNWQVYVLATTSHRVVDAALGYFINPIVTVLLGVLVLRERLRPVQWIAVGISVAAVAVLTTEARSLPVIALALAASFGGYGLIKKRVGTSVDALTGLALETAWLAPVAVVQLTVVGTTTGLAFGAAGPRPTLLLAGAGVVTAVPLLLFGAAARRLPLSVVGFLQYLAPILQLATGVLVLHEPMPPARLAGFALVWVALLLLIGESLRHGWAGRGGAAGLAPVTDG